MKERRGADERQEFRLTESFDINYICELPFHYPEDHGWFKHINPTTIVSVLKLEAGSIPSGVRRVAFHPGMIPAPRPFSSQGLMISYRIQRR